MFDGGTGSDRAYSVLETADGSLVVGATRQYEQWLVKLTGDGTVEWEKTYGSGKAHALCATLDGGLAVAGPAADGRLGVLVLALDGSIVWQKTFLDEGDSRAEAASIRPTADGGYILAGDHRQYPEPWFLKLDAAGDPEWDRALPLGGRGKDAVPDAAGYYVAGWAHPPIRGAIVSASIRRGTPNGCDPTAGTARSTPFVSPCPGRARYWSEGERTRSGQAGRMPGSSSLV
jgi:outer membrane protein assembly factor BamB